MANVFAPTSLPVNPILAPPPGPQFQNLPEQPQPEEAQTPTELAALMAVRSSDFTEDANLMTFEDTFPKLEFDDDTREDIVQWFEEDLKTCLANVKKMRHEWGKYRAVYMLQYVEKFYPDLGIGADFASGVLCEKVLEAMNRLKKSLWSARPLFAVDVKLTGADVNIDVIKRAEWALHTMLQRELNIYNTIGDSGIFEFILDGSMIIEADTIFEKIPQRTIKVYTDQTTLLADQEKALDKSQVTKALDDISRNGYARLLIEQDIVTKNGLQYFMVNKNDHLIPEGVLFDKDMKFRARRMYMTGADLQLMASDNVGMYDQKAVDVVLGTRADVKSAKTSLKSNDKDDIAMDRVRKYEENYDLAYQWQEEGQTLEAVEGQNPMRDIYNVYRVTCDLGYKTKNDPDGAIPKRVVIDYSPEGKQILRAIAYPHFHNTQNWFHFKLGFAPNSYYGFGFGARLMQDDFLESNAVDLTLDAAALAVMNPFVAKHPEAGGRGNPFTGGYGPGKVGFVNDVNDFKQLQSPPVNTALLNMILPLTSQRVSNRTSVTSLLQGQTESHDPRSPAQKTAMLIGQATVGLDIMVADWNRTGWEPLAQYTWMTMNEHAQYIKAMGGDLSQVCGGLIVEDEVVLTPADENKVKLLEVSKNFIWSSLASTDYLSPQLRQQKFLQLMNIFMPMLQTVAQFNPQAFQTYFMRWLQRAADEFDVQGADYLIPTEKDLMQVPPEALLGAMQGMQGNMRANMSQSGLMTSGGEGGQQPVHSQPVQKSQPQPGMPPMRV